MKTILRVVAFLVCSTIVYAGIPRTFADKKKQFAPLDSTVVEQSLRQIQKEIVAFKQKTAQTAMINRQNTTSVLAHGIASRELAAIVPGAGVVWNEHNVTPIFISADRLASASPNTLGATLDIQAVDATQIFLSTYGGVLGLHDAKHELVSAGQSTDEMGNTHVRLQQTYRGISVWGSDAYVHVNAMGDVYAFNGRYVPTPVAVASEAVVSGSTAVHTALADLATRATTAPPSAALRGLFGDNAPLIEQTIFCDRATQIPSLAWHITARPNFIERWEYFIDAVSGAILFQYNNTCSDGPQTATAGDLRGVQQQTHTYQVGSTYYLVDASRQMYNAAKSVPPDSLTGAILTIDARSTDLTSFFYATSANNTWSDASSVSAHFNAGVTYEYYRTHHSRNAIDDKGSTMISVFHVTENGKGLDNAYWNGKCMVYGDGLQEFQHLAAGLDVAGHEITHGVTENSAALVYLSQSGALNESMSDVFGCFVENRNWKIGEDVVRPGVFSSGALRDMADPHNGAQQNENGWQPSVMSEWVQLAEDAQHDNGGVHVNSGIPNHAAYIIQAAIGAAKAEKIYYQALTKHLTKNSQFIDARLTLVLSAKELYGDNSAEMNAVKSAFDQVQIFDGTATKAPGDLPPVVGDEWIMFVGAVFSPQDFTLYRGHAVANPQQSDFQHISSQSIGSRPAVSDDGTIALFVSTSGDLYLIGANSATPTETALVTAMKWGSCAISRDGLRVALTAQSADKKIYVLDISGAGSSHTFTLYTPTTVQGVNSNGVQYASIMDWDPAGEYLVYDCLNMIPSTTDSIQYWDINALRAWSKAGNTYGDGSIQRIFPAQPAGVNIGNPAFSKNSPYIIAFDLIDNGARTSSVIGANLQTGDVGKIADNVFDVPGFPSYSRLDNTVAYTTLVTVGGNFQYGIAWQGVDASKIAASGAPAVWAAYCQVPVWYTIGTRPVGVGDPVGPVAPSIARISTFPDPVVDVARFTISVASNVRGSLSVFDLLGRKVATVWEGTLPEGIHEIPFSTSGLRNGMYVVALSDGMSATSRTFTVMR